MLYKINNSFEFFLYAFIYSHLALLFDLEDNSHILELSAELLISNKMEELFFLFFRILFFFSFLLHLYFFVFLKYL